MIYENGFEPKMGSLPRLYIITTPIRGAHRDRKGPHTPLRQADPLKYKHVSNNNLIF